MRFVFDFRGAALFCALWYVDVRVDVCLMMCVVTRTKLHRQLKR